MSAEEIITKIKEQFKDKIIINKKSDRRYYIDVLSQDIISIVKFMFNDLKGRFVIISGVDTRAGIDMLYHFAYDSVHIVCTLKTIVPKPFPEIESIANEIPGAEWIEREIHDLLGVQFTDHPNLKRLILADDWPEGVYPLRLDFDPESVK